MKEIKITTTLPSTDYELIDSGDGEKLERFGKYVLSRPDPQALWSKKIPATEWKKADASFTREETRGDWNMKKDMPREWEISFADLKFHIKPTAFKHTGLFPEQEPNWSWMREKINKAKTDSSNADLEILNLFGYTGGASLACAQVGAKVVHVDGSKSAITWARENGEISGLKDKPIRWILDDARTFVKREIKRGRAYDAIIMDPPAFGHGPENELWKIEEHLLPLMADCFSILKDKPLFFLINGYSAGYSALAYENILESLVKKYGGKIEIGELTIGESGSNQRLLPSGIFARWSK